MDLPSGKSAARGAGAARARGAATAAAPDFQARGDREPHVGHVDRKRGAFFHQVLFNDKRITGNLGDLIRIARLIQSQRKPWAASTARGKINADGTFFFFRKIPIKLGFCAFRQFDHGILLGKYAFNATKHERSESQIASFCLDPRPLAGSSDGATQQAGIMRGC